MTTPCSLLTQRKKDFHIPIFLDKEVIPYRYISCCSCSSCWGDRLQESL